MRRRAFDLRLFEKPKSDAAHLSRLGDAQPMLLRAERLKPPSTYLKQPLICAIRRLVSQVSFASEYTGHIASTAGELSPGIFHTLVSDVEYASTHIAPIYVSLRPRLQPPSQALVQRCTVGSYGGGWMMRATFGHRPPTMGVVTASKRIRLPLYSLYFIYGDVIMHTHMNVLPTRDASHPWAACVSFGTDAGDGPNLLISHLPSPFSSLRLPRAGGGTRHPPPFDYVSIENRKIPLDDMFSSNTLGVQSIVMQCCFRLRALLPFPLNVCYIAFRVSVILPIARHACIRDTFWEKWYHCGWPIVLPRP